MVWCLLTCSVCFLTHPKTVCTGMALTRIGWTILQQASVEKTSLLMFRQIHLKVKFVSNEVPLYQRTLACVKLTKKKKRQKNNVTYLVRLFSEDKHYTKWWETQDYRRKKYNSVEVTKNLFSRRKLVWHWWLILLFKIIYLMLSCTQKPPLSVEDTTIN